MGISIDLTESDVRVLALVLGDFLCFHNEISRNSALEHKIQRDVMGLKDKMAPIFESARTFDQSKGKTPYQYKMTKLGPRRQCGEKGGSDD